ncbi:MAG: hypothetical protein Q9159_005859 [Coniocarpon cinnabarinum]
MSSSNYRSQDERGPSYGTIYASPTDSEFSENYSDSDDVRRWDERRVGDWLRSINASQYVDLFRVNNITGENLMDIDQSVLKEMGVQKVGDRVRIGAQAKLFRKNEYQRRQRIRDSIAAQEHTPPSSASPRPPRSATSQQTPKEEKRMSRIPVGATDALGLGGSLRDPKSKVITSSTGSRPASPMPIEQDWRRERSKKSSASSPREKVPPMQERSNGSYPHSTSRGDLSVRTARPEHTPRNGGFKTPTTAVEMPRGLSLSSDQRGASLLLPPGSHAVKVIHESGQTTVCDVDGIRSAEDMVARIHKSARLSEPSKNYSFYVMDGIDANYTACRRLTMQELFTIGLDMNRPERQKLIIRKIAYGEPEGVQLVEAAKIAKEQLRATTSPSAHAGFERSRMKIAKLTGEPFANLPPVSYPMSPASMARREEHLSTAAAHELEQADSSGTIQSRRRQQRSGDSLSGERPDSTYVLKDPKSFFPEIEAQEIDKTVRASIRRSQRLSRANSRLSTASRLSIVSNFSIGSNPNDVPAVPAIPAGFANGEQTPIRQRPLSIMRMGRPQSHVRDSIASSTLDPLDEESSYEPNRKSYVSFGSSAPGSATASISEHDTKTAIPPALSIRPDATASPSSYLDDGGSSPLTEAGSSINELREVLAEDGEQPDEELDRFLASGTDWENIRYIKGKLIGQGSFGSVYMALHTLTAELMAVKQVELPSTAGTAVDTKKNNMIEALKREIALLRDLKHPNIVQYLGSQSDGNTLNIFLEYVPGGSIAKMLVEYGAMAETMVSRLTKQVLVGLAYLHSKDIIHRDIKGANILVDTHGAVKISDFGISKRVQDSKTLLSSPDGRTAQNTSSSSSRRGGGLPSNRVSMQGSVFWMAPEVVKQTAYTRKADIWSLGCLVVEMLTGSHPHPNLSQLQAIFKIGGNSGGRDPSPEVPKGVSKECRAFLEATFQGDFGRRPEAVDLGSMAFILGDGSEKGGRRRG